MARYFLSFQFFFGSVFPSLFYSVAPSECHAFLFVCSHWALPADPQLDFPKADINITGHCDGVIFMEAPAEVTWLWLVPGGPGVSIKPRCFNFHKHQWSGKPEEVAITLGWLACFLSTYFVNGARIFSLSQFFGGWWGGGIILQLWLSEIADTCVCLRWPTTIKIDSDGIWCLPHSLGPEREKKMGGEKSTSGRRGKKSTRTHTRSATTRKA